MTAQLNVRNLLDKEYFENPDTGTNNFPRIAIYPAEPLTFLGSVRVEY